MLKSSKLKSNFTILINPLKYIIGLSDGEGTNCSYREGIVWKQVDGDLQFKVISNRYLEKEVLPLDDVPE